VSEVRGRGLFVGVDFRHPGTNRPIKGVAVRASNLALQDGILVLPAGVVGHVLELSPPLVIHEEQLEWVVPRLEKVIKEALAE
jgi:4-aminobutyrate aminotransferase